MAILHHSPSKKEKKAAKAEAKIHAEYERILKE